MVMKVLRKQTVMDEWGNVREAVTTEQYEIEKRDFQYARKVSELEVNDTGIIKSRLRVLFLREENAGIVLDTGDEIEIEGKRYTVLQVREYAKHKEVIVHGVE